MAAFVQPPAASSQTLRASIFGNLGVVLGHEVTHGFDSVGHKYDEQGNLWDWWDRQTIKLFAAKTQCFLDQAGEVEFAGHKLSNCIFKNTNHTVSLAGVSGSNEGP